MPAMRQAVAAVLLELGVLLALPPVAAGGAFHPSGAEESSPLTRFHAGDCPCPT